MKLQKIKLQDLSAVTLNEREMCQILGGTDSSTTDPGSTTDYSTSASSDPYALASICDNAPKPKDPPSLPNNCKLP